MGLAGCGSQSPEATIAVTARGQYGAGGASCSKEGIAIFVGEREDVYGCVLEDVPPENRPIEYIGSPSLKCCYIYTGGEVFEVTDKLQALATAQEASGVTADEFSCLN